VRLLYLRQAQNYLTGERSCIMVRALPRRTGYNDAWLPTFVADARRRIVALLWGSFRHVDVRTALALFDYFEGGASPAVPAENKGAHAAIEKRSGTDTGAIVAEELRYVLTPHDLMMAFIGMFVKELGVTFPGSLDLQGPYPFADVLKDHFFYPITHN